MGFFFEYFAENRETICSKENSTSWLTPVLKYTMRSVKHLAFNMQWAESSEKSSLWACKQPPWKIRFFSYETSVFLLVKNLGLLLASLEKYVTVKADEGLLFV